MAIPSRLKSTTRPIAKVAKAITPTGIGVLLSVGAHLALLAFGPHTDVSFAALSKTAQEADAEEAIVPVMQLSPAERNRLPSFAQPRQSPPAATGLRSLSLPPGLPFSPNASTFKRRPVAANTLPSPSKTTTSNLGALRGKLPANITAPSRFSFNIPTTQVPQRSSNPQTVGVLPDPPPRTSTPADSGPRLSTEGLEGTGANLPNSSPGAANSDPRSLADALRDTEASGVAANPGTAPNTSAPSGEAASTAEAGEQPANIPVEAPVIATAPAQGKPSQLVNGNEYDKRYVTEAEAEENTNEWLSETAAGRENVAQANAEITINPDFKSCRDQPPVPARIGVIANPDGTQENATILKSTGYDVLNRLALRTLEYEDFGQPELPTQYVVDVKVNYEPQECAQALPDTPPSQ